jgi:hypothetical protein
MSQLRRVDTSYQTLLNVLSQLEEDQTYYEASLGQELRGHPHVELVIIGGKMCKKVRLFADYGQNADLQDAFVSKVTETMKGYMNLLMPPKIFGGFCPCLKPARFGPEYEKKFVVVLARVVSALFECEAVVIEFCSERINLGSLHFFDYLSRMNVIRSTLSSISGRLTVKDREALRIELTAVIEMVRKYLILFNAETIELISESDDKLDSLTEMLIAPAEWNIAKIVLVKVISSLQKIMNSAAELSLKKSKDNLRTLDSLNSQLKSAWDAEVAAFCAIEARIDDRILKDNLHTLVMESEDIHFKAISKIKEGMKAWTTIKCQSNRRPVMVYTEDYENDDNNQHQFDIFNEQKSDKQDVQFLPSDTLKITAAFDLLKNFNDTKESNSLSTKLSKSLRLNDSGTSDTPKSRENDNEDDSNVVANNMIKSNDSNTYKKTKYSLIADDN